MAAKAGSADDEGEGDGEVVGEVPLVGAEVSPFDAGPDGGFSWVTGVLFLVVEGELQPEVMTARTASPAHINRRGSPTVRTVVELRWNLRHCSLSVDG
jgi:hypothetical protein